jgi:hypothetical protein
MISLHDLTDEFASPAAIPVRSAALSGLKVFFSRWLAATIAAREAKANRLVNSYLERQHPPVSLGETSSEIQATRR